MQLGAMAFLRMEGIKGKEGMVKEGRERKPSS